MCRMKITLPVVMAFLLVVLLHPVSGIDELVINAPSEPLVNQTLTFALKDNNGSSVQNAMVYFTLNDGMPVRRDTDAEGKSIFKALNTGTLKVRAEKTGYNISSMEIEIVTPTPTPVPSSGGGGRGGTTGAAPVPVTVSVLKVAKETIAGIKAGVPASVTFSKSDADATGVEGIALTSKSATSNVQVEISKYGGKPADITSDPGGGNVYQYLGLSLKNLASTEVSSATVSFKVKQSWISSNNIDKDTVRLNRYSGGKWGALSTIITHEDGSYMYYDAETSGFSVFAVTGEIISIATATPTTAPTVTASAAPETTPTTTPTPEGIDTTLVVGITSALVFVVLVVVVIMYREQIMTNLQKVWKKK